MDQITNGPSGFLEAPAPTEERGVVVDWRARAEKAEARVEEMRARIRQLADDLDSRDLSSIAQFLRSLLESRP